MSARQTVRPKGKAWRVDFSLALFNRSGKYQIGREIIEANKEQIESVWYWRHAAAQTPTGLLAKMLGKGEKIEHAMRMAMGDMRQRLAGNGQRWLHLDPLTLLHHRPGAGDVVIVHDLGPLTHPDLFAPGVGRAYGFAYRLLAASKAKPIFVSRASQRAYETLYGSASQNAVIYPPVAARLFSGNRTRPGHIEAPYLLTVGAVGTRKNQARSIQAFAASGLAAKGVDYVLCGSREPGHEEVAALAERVPGVKLLSFVEEDELRWLYANAAGFVLPSQLEGFGMPVAEALAFGLVPIVSRGSVLSEVAGEAALEVDPHDIAEIAQAMVHVVSLDEAERAERKASMDASLARFSPEIFVKAWQDLLGTE